MTYSKPNDRKPGKKKTKYNDTSRRSTRGRDKADGDGGAPRGAGPSRFTRENPLVRLNKTIADSGICSRRNADELIAAGKVSINGKRITSLATMVNPKKDKILVNGKALPSVKPLYIAFHKPKGYITTRHDEEGRKTIYDMLPEKWHSANPAGRLDKDTTGLLILSNDGDFLHRITHPSFHCLKRYRVTTEKPLTEDAARRLFDGIQLEPENKLARMEELRALPVDNAHPSEWPYEVTLATGYYRQIRRSFEAVGYDVEKLKRVAFGYLTLGQMKPGECRMLRPFEVNQLLKSSKASAAQGRNKKIIEAAQQEESGPKREGRPASKEQARPRQTEFSDRPKRQTPGQRPGTTSTRDKFKRNSFGKKEDPTKTTTAGKYAKPFPRKPAAGSKAGEGQFDANKKPRKDYAAKSDERKPFRAGTARPAKRFDKSTSTDERSARPERKPFKAGAAGPSKRFSKPTSTEDRATRPERKPFGKRSDSAEGATRSDARKPFRAGSAGPAKRFDRDAGEERSDRPERKPFGKRSSDNQKNANRRKQGAGSRSQLNPPRSSKINKPKLSGGASKPKSSGGASKASSRKTARKPQK